MGRRTISTLLPLCIVFGMLLDLACVAAPPAATQAATLGGAQAAAETGTPGGTAAANPVRVWDETRENPPLHLHFAAIDLRDPSITVRVVRCGADPDGPGPWQTTLATVRSVAERENLDVAVNGSLFAAKDSIGIFGRKNYYFDGNWARVLGWAMSDGQLWSVTPADATLIVDVQGRVRIGRYARIPEDARQVVSGSELLVSGGHNVASGADLAPRTGVGVDREGRSLLLLVVDGRRPAYSAGVTLPQLADELIRRGCSDALNLDGGGSSTLIVREPPGEPDGQIRLASYPSDGHDFFIPLSLERPVADVFGITLAAHLPTRRSANGK